MFRSLLIANRGEIACRIARTARRMGIETIAVFSEADAQAMHVAAADRAYPIGPAPARDSYLNIARIIETAKQAGAEAIHPGYGFLSENPALAEACAEAGVAVEINSETSSTAEVRVCRRGHVPQYMLEQEQQNDEEAGAAEKGAQVGDNEEEGDVNVIPPQTDIFTWRDVDYDIPVKEGTRRLLDHVSGYVKPGTLTALMGTSGAGKTTLLDVSLSHTLSFCFILTTL